MQRVTACFSQMGGLRGLLPLFEGARDLDVRWFAREPALGYLRGLGHRADPPEQLRFEAGDADILVTDTINLGRAEDAGACRQGWRLAAQAGIPSVAFVDSWWGYRERFVLPGETLSEAVLPDAIAVVDDVARADMAGLGFAVEQLHVLGSPWLSAIAEGGTPAGEARGRGRRRFGMDEGAKVLTFASQPLARVLNDRDSWGFTEQDVIAALVGACAALPEKTRRVLRLIVLAHPEEDAAELAAMIEAVAPPFPVETLKLADPLSLVRASDAVTGMFSILLVEAALCGLPVASIQPGLKREDMLVTNRIGATIAVRDPARLPGVIAGLLCDEDFRAECLRRQATFPVVRKARGLWRDLLRDLKPRGSQP